MKLRKFNEGTILDELQAEEKRKEEERRLREEEAKRNQQELIRQHQNLKKASEDEIMNKEMPDYNLEKAELLDKLGEIVFYSLKENDEEPKKELLALIDKYSKYLGKTKVLSNTATQDVKRFSDYSMPSSPKETNSDITPDIVNTIGDIGSALSSGM